MTESHHVCPECDGVESEVAYRDWYSDHAVVRRACIKCETMWDVRYSDPEITEVSTPEELET